MTTPFRNIPLALALLLLAACAANPYRTAQTPEQYALATYQAAAALVHQATRVALDPEVDAGVRAQVKAATLALEAPLATLHDTAIAVEQANAALAAGTGTAEQVRIALEALAAANTAASAGITTLTEALP